MKIRYIIPFLVAIGTAVFLDEKENEDIDKNTS